MGSKTWPILTSEEMCRHNCIHYLQSQVQKKVLSMMYYNFKTIGRTLTEVWHPYLCDVLHNYVDTEWALNPNWFGYILY